MNTTCVRIMKWSALAYFVGLVLNYGTLIAYGGMPVPFNGPTGYRLDSRHIIGHAPFGDNITLIPGWYISIGDVLVIVGSLVLWASTATYLIGRARARDRARKARKTTPTPVVE